MYKNVYISPVHNGLETVSTFSRTARYIAGGSQDGNVHNNEKERWTTPQDSMGESYKGEGSRPKETCSVIPTIRIIKTDQGC